MSGKARIYDTLHRAFVVVAMATTVAGCVYIPNKVKTIQRDGLRVEEYAKNNNVSLKQAAKELGFRVADDTPAEE